LTNGGALTGVVIVGAGPGRAGPVVFTFPPAAIDGGVRGVVAAAVRTTGSSGGGDSTAISTATPTNPKMSDATQ
jgi:hypothetical protein